MLLLTLLASIVWAERTPRDYRLALGDAAAAEVARLAREQGLAAAEDFAADWRRQVGPAAPVEYELGLAARLAGQDRAALAHLDRALSIDPSLVTARYDRGELRLQRGEIAAAEDDFTRVVTLAPAHWAGHFRLADVAARERRPADFERHLLDALRHGFALRSLVGDPHWRGYARDAELGPVLRRVITVYQDESLFDALTEPMEEGR
jgi:tetratricopeptide (TPR) repeat protein